MRGSKAESALIVTLVFIIAVIILLNALGLVLSNAPWGFGVLLILAYTTYWALSVRSRLSARIYRSQALGIGLVAVAWASFLVSTYISFNVLKETSYEANYLASAVLTFAFLITFYWIDVSVLASRKSDPFFRNTLRWKQVRLVLWPIIAGAIVAYLALLLLTKTSIANSSNNPLPILLIFLFFFGVLLSGSIYLPVSARSSKDRTLRAQLKWFGLFAILLFVSSLANGFFFSSGNVQISIAFRNAGYLGASYCLYRSAKSLAPISQIPREVRAKLRDR